MVDFIRRQEQLAKQIDEQERSVDLTTLRERRLNQNPPPEQTSQPATPRPPAVRQDRPNTFLGQLIDVPEETTAAAIARSSRKADAGEFMRALDGSLRNLAAQRPAIGALVHGALGNEERALELAEEQARRRTEGAGPGPRVTDFREIRSMGDAADYLAGLAGGQALNTVSTLAGALVGRRVGAVVGGAKKLNNIRKLLSARAGNQAVSTASRRSSQRAAEALARRVDYSQNVGTALGGMMAAAGMMAPSQADLLVAEGAQGSVQDRAQAGLASLVGASGLEALPITRFMNKIGLNAAARRTALKGFNEAGQTAAQRAGVSTTGGFLRRLGADTASQAAAEGITETAQELILRGAHAAFRDEVGYMDNEAIGDYLNSFVAGSIIGGTMGAFGSTVDAASLRIADAATKVGEVSNQTMARADEFQRQRFRKQFFSSERFRNTRAFREVRELDDYIAANGREGPEVRRNLARIVGEENVDDVLLAAADRNEPLENILALEFRETQGQGPAVQTLASRTLGATPEERMAEALSQNIGQELTEEFGSQQLQRTLSQMDEAQRGDVYALVGDLIASLEDVDNVNQDTVTEFRNRLSEVLGDDVDAEAALEYAVRKQLMVDEAIERFGEGSEQFGASQGDRLDAGGLYNPDSGFSEAEAPRQPLVGVMGLDPEAGGQRVNRDKPQAVDLGNGETLVPIVATTPAENGFAPAANKRAQQLSQQLGVDFVPARLGDYLRDNDGDVVGQATSILERARGKAKWAEREGDITTEAEAVEFLNQLNVVVPRNPEEFARVGGEVGQSPVMGERAASDRSFSPQQRLNFTRPLDPASGLPREDQVTLVAFDPEVRTEIRSLQNKKERTPEEQKRLDELLAQGSGQRVAVDLVTMNRQFARNNRGRTFDADDLQITQSGLGQLLETGNYRVPTDAETNQAVNEARKKLRNPRLSKNQRRAIEKRLAQMTERGNNEGLQEMAVVNRRSRQNMPNVEDLLSRSWNQSQGLDAPIGTAVVEPGDVQRVADALWDTPDTNPNQRVLHGMAQALDAVAQGDYEGANAIYGGLGVEGQRIAKDAYDNLAKGATASEAAIRAGDRMFPPEIAAKRRELKRTRLAAARKAAKTRLKNQTLREYRGVVEKHLPDWAFKKQNSFGNVLLRGDKRAAAAVFKKLPHKLRYQVTQGIILAQAEIAKPQVQRELETALDPFIKDAVAKELDALNLIEGLARQRSQWKNAIRDRRAMSRAAENETAKEEGREAEKDEVDNLVGRYDAEGWLNLGADPQFRGVYKALHGQPGTGVSERLSMADFALFIADQMVGERGIKNPDVPYNVRRGMVPDNVAKLKELNRKEYAKKKRLSNRVLSTMLFEYQSQALADGGTENMAQAIDDAVDFTFDADGPVSVAPQFFVDRGIGPVLANALSLAVRASYGARSSNQPGERSAVKTNAKRGLAELARAMKRPAFQRAYQNYLARPQVDTQASRSFAAEAKPEMNSVLARLFRAEANDTPSDAIREQAIEAIYMSNQVLEDYASKRGLTFSSAMKWQIQKIQGRATQLALDAKTNMDLMLAVGSANDAFTQVYTEIKPSRTEVEPTRTEESRKLESMVNAVLENVPGLRVKVVSDLSELLALDLSNLDKNTKDSLEREVFSAQDRPHSRGAVFSHREDRFGVIRDNGGDVVMFINKNMTESARVTTALHEMGHVIDYQLFSKADTQTQQAVVAEYNKWFIKHFGKLPKSIVDAQKAKQGNVVSAFMKMNNMGFNMGTEKFSSLTNADQVYLTSFREWFADRTANWATTNKQAVSRVERFFKAVAALYRKLKAALGADNDSPILDAWLDSVLNGTREVEYEQLLARNRSTFWLENTGQSNTRALLGRRMRIARQGGDFVDDFNGYAQIMASRTALVDTFSDSATDGIAYLVDFLLKAPERALLGRVFNRPLVREQILELVDDGSMQGRMAAELMDTDENYFIATGIQAYQAGVLDIGAQAKGTIDKLFQAVKNEALAEKTDPQQAKELMDAIIDGRIAQRRSVFQDLAKTGSNIQKGLYSISHAQLRTVARFAEAQREGHYSGLNAETVAQRLADTHAFQHTPMADRRRLAADILDGVFTKNLIEQTINKPTWALDPAQGFKLQAQLAPRAITPLARGSRAVLLSVGNVLNRLLGGQMMRARSSGIPALVSGANLLYRDPTTKRFGQSYDQVKTMGIAKYRKRYEATTAPLTEEEKVNFRNAIQAGRRMTIDAGDSEAEVNAQREYIRLMADIRKDMEDAGLKMGDRGIDSGRIYFPWVFDESAFGQRGHEFKAFAKQDKFRASWIALAKSKGLTWDPQEVDAELDKFIDHYIRALANQDGFADSEAVVNPDSESQPHLRSMFTRELDFLFTKGNEADRETLAGFFSEDFNNTIAMYINQAVKRATYSRLLGKGKREAIEGNIISQGGTEADVQMFRNMIDMQMGTYGLEHADSIKWLINTFGKPFGKSYEDVDPKTLREIQGWVITYQNVRLLAFAALTNVVDSAGILVRSGDLNATINGFREAMRAIRRKPGDMAALEEQAEMLGVAERVVVQDAIGQLYGAAQFTGPAARVNDFFFKYNGMVVLNRFLRMSALSTGQVYLKKHVKRAKNGSSTSKELLRELGVTENDVRFDDDGNIVLLPDDTDITDVEQVNADRRVKDALFRFVDEAVMRPSAMQRPGWGNDPNWAVFFHLKAFMYSYHERHVRRILSRARNQQDLGPLLLALSFPAMMFGVDMLRQFVQHGPEGDPRKRSWGVREYAFDAMHRSGLYGVGNYVPDIIQTAQMGGSIVGEMGGPAVSQMFQIGDALLGDRSKMSVLERSLPANNAWRAIGAWADGMADEAEDIPFMFQGPLYPAANHNILNTPWMGLQPAVDDAERYLGGLL